VTLHPRLRGHQSSIGWCYGSPALTARGEREATVSRVPAMETGRQRGGSGVELDGNGYRVPKRGTGGGIDSSGGWGGWGCLL
jgi:hypothetical protein